MISQNGVGAFILQCKRLDFHYCDWAGSSKGMKYELHQPVSSYIANRMTSSFLHNSLSKFASANPQIEITVSPRPRKHPVIIGHYINGREKAICVRNLQKEQILQKAELLRDASGEKLKRVTKPVKSINESVRGVWSPFHGGGINV
jgi:large subunit ribosomal protein L43